MRLKRFILAFYLAQILLWRVVRVKGVIHPLPGLLGPFSGLPHDLWGIVEPKCNSCPVSCKSRGWRKYPNTYSEWVNFGSHLTIVELLTRRFLSSRVIRHRILSNNSFGSGIVEEDNGLPVLPDGPSDESSPSSPLNYKQVWPGEFAVSYELEFVPITKSTRPFLRHDYLFEEHCLKWAQLS